MNKHPALSSPPTARSGRGRQPAYVLDEQIGFILRQAYQKNSLLFVGYFGDDLTPTQWAAIARLGEVGGCSQNLLGRLTAMDAATIKGVVDRLRVRNLVTIELNPKDRRRSMVAATKAGERFARQATMLARRITKETLAPLRPVEQRQIVRLLQKMI